MIGFLYRALPIGVVLAWAAYATFAMAKREAPLKIMLLAASNTAAFILIARRLWRSD